MLSAWSTGSALLNLVISYSASWQGLALARWGYPVTLSIDAAAGLACIALLPLMRRRGEQAAGERIGAAPEAAGR